MKINSQSVNLSAGKGGSVNTNDIEIIILFLAKICAASL